MEAVGIVAARCAATSRLFGIRFVSSSPESWLGEWAFDLLDDEGEREGYDRTELGGTFGFGREYPGCPYCNSMSLIKCGCGRVTCWDGKTPTAKCAWCGSRASVGGTVENLSAGADV